jgi:hypothetical protein
MSLKDKFSRLTSYFVEMPEATTPPPPTVPPILVDPEAHSAATTNSSSPTAFDATSDAEPADPAGGSPDAFSDALAAVERARAEATAKVQAQGPPKSVEQIVRESEGPNLDEIKVNFGEAIPTLPDGTLDFSALYAKASLPDPPFTAEQLLQMLNELPAAMPLEMKRQTVQVTINALGKHIGASPETIVADASRKLAALSAFVDESETRTNEFVAATESEIAALLAQVEEKRRSVMASTQRLLAVQKSCDREADRLDDVLGFFCLEGAVESKTEAFVAEEDDTPPTIPLPHHPPALPILTGDTSPDAPNPANGREISISWEQAPSVEVGPPTETPPPLPIARE